MEVFFLLEWPKFTHHEILCCKHVPKDCKTIARFTSFFLAKQDSPCPLRQPATQKGFAPYSTGQLTKNKKDPFKKKKIGWTEEVLDLYCPRHWTKSLGGPTIGHRLMNTNLSASLQLAQNQHDAPAGAQTLAFLPNPGASWIRSPLSHLILSHWLQWWVRSKS